MSCPTKNTTPLPNLVFDPSVFSTTNNLPKLNYAQFAAFILFLYALFFLSLEQGRVNASPKFFEEKIT
jgi:hypothetical protein